MSFPPSLPVSVSFDQLMPSVNDTDVQRTDEASVRSYTNKILIVCDGVICEEPARRK